MIVCDSILQSSRRMQDAYTLTEREACFRQTHQVTDMGIYNTGKGRKLQKIMHKKTQSEFIHWLTNIPRFHVKKMMNRKQNSRNMFKMRIYYWNLLKTKTVLFDRLYLKTAMMDCSREL